MNGTREESKTSRHALVALLRRYCTFSRSPRGFQAYCIITTTKSMLDAPPLIKQKLSPGAQYR